MHIGAGTVAHLSNFRVHMISNLTLRSALIAAVTVMSTAGCATSGSLRNSVQQPRVATAAPAQNVDTFARRWAALEITRAETRVVWERWASQSMQLDEQIAAVQEQLIAVSDDARGPRRAMQYVVDALDAQQRTLASRHRDLLVMYVPGSAAVTAMATQEQLVAQRRAELRASLTTAVEVGSRR